MQEDFISSTPLTIGIELEVQVVSTHNFALSPQAQDLLRQTDGSRRVGAIKPETGRSMIELCTGVCGNYAQASAQLMDLRDELVDAADFLGIAVCGGGTNPFHYWFDERPNGSERSAYLMGVYEYLYQQFTIFGQHVHIGCPDGDTALRLLHSLSAYVHHFIALAASSPFSQEHDTGYACSRLNNVAPFPLSGHAPFCLTWREFCDYMKRMKATGMAATLKDFYWDIRPSPGYGTVEVRVMDTPLTIELAASIGAYIQCLASLFFNEAAVPLAESNYEIYAVNRFSACRHGLDGMAIDLRTGRRSTIRDEILMTLESLMPHAVSLGAQPALAYLMDGLARTSAVAWMREIHSESQSLEEVVRQQCSLWRSPGSILNASV
ncbi:YbdK family carboxylate-amine ligase [Paraburkholderia sp. 2C]|jgi:glutamate---cysteine ligase / carboxylate-amine ligase